jgi:hypothetical protein
MKLSKILLAGLVVFLSACVGMGLKEPINVDVVGLEPMRSDAMEARFLVKLRVQNPMISRSVSMASMSSSMYAAVGWLAA